MQNQHHDDQQDHHAHFEHTGMYDYEAILHSQRITWDDLKAHLLGPVISIVVHIILLVSVCSMTLFEGAKEADDVSVDSKTMEVKPIEEPPPPPEPDEIIEVTDVVIETDRPMMDSPMETMVDDMNVETVSSTINAPEIMIVAENNSAWQMPATDLYVNRSGEGQLKALQKYKAPKGVSPAVKKGLNWLAKQQNEDGSWGQNKRAYTSLAILTFLAHGDTHTSEEYGEIMTKGFKQLVAINTATLKNKMATGFGGAAYESAMIAYALSEAYGMTKIPMLKEAMNSRIKYIIEGMNKSGSYGYGYPEIRKGDPEKGIQEGERSDLSVAGWHYQALKAAYAAGCDVEDLDKALDKARKALKKIHYIKANKSFNYDNYMSEAQFMGAGASKQGMTAVGTLCLQLLGEGQSTEAKAALKTIESNPEWMTCDFANLNKNNTAPFYGWYYQTQAIFQGNEGSGGGWAKWNRTFSQTYLKKQNAEGYFDHDNDGTQKPVLEMALPGAGNDRKLYCTTLALLTLQVYYRFLPTFKLTHSSEKKAPDTVKTDDLDIKIE